MKYVEVNFTAKIPVPATRGEIDAWIKFNLHASGSLPLDNPLSNYDMESDWSSVVVTHTKGV